MISFSRLELWIAAFVFFGFCWALWKTAVAAMQAKWGVAKLEADLEALKKQLNA